MEKEKDEKLNEYRQIAGLATKPLYKEDAYIRKIKTMAGM
jgi:hypothetical protein